MVRQVNNSQPLTLAAPALTGATFFVLIPLLGSVLLSVCQWYVGGHLGYAGLSNFVELFTNISFWRACGFSAILLLCSGICVPASFWIANVVRSSRFLTVAFFAPSACAGIGIYAAWRVSLSGAGLASLLWNSSYAKIVLAVVIFWASVGGPTMLLFIAALNKMPRERREAAVLDGSSETELTWIVLWPSCRGVAILGFILSAVAWTQTSFDAAYALTLGGPFGATKAIPFFIYDAAFSRSQFGLASAAAVLMLMVFGLGLIALKRSKQWVI